MNIEDYKDFCDGGRYGGSKVLVQLVEAGTFTAMLDERREIGPAMLVRDVRTEMLKEIEAMQPPPSDEQLAQYLAQLPPPGTKKAMPVPAVPILVGTLEARGNLLLLRYSGPDGTKLIVSLRPEDIKHVTVAEATRIVT